MVALVNYTCITFIKLTPGLRLHVKGLMNNADNLITIRCFLPFFFSLMENLLIQPVANYSAKCVFQYLPWKTSVIDSVFSEKKNIRKSWHNFGIIV